MYMKSNTDVGELIDIEWKVLLDRRTLVEWYLGVFARSITIAVWTNRQGTHGTYDVVSASEALLVGGGTFLFLW